MAIGSQSSFHNMTPSNKKRFIENLTGDEYRKLMQTGDVYNTYEAMNDRISSNQASVLARQRRAVEASNAKIAASNWVNKAIREEEAKKKKWLLEDQKIYGNRNYDFGSDGPSTRQSNKPPNKAKQVISQTFDLHGITETQINTDPDGTVTEVKKKTPSSIFDDYRNEEGEPFYSEARESARSSIATPPAKPVGYYGEPGYHGEPGVRAPDFNITTPMLSASSPIVSARAEHVNDMDRQVAAEAAVRQENYTSYPDNIFRDEIINYIKGITPFSTLSEEEVIAATPDWDVVSADYEPANIKSITDHHAEVAAVLGSDASQPEIQAANERAKLDNVPIQTVLEDPKLMAEISEQVTKTEVTKNLTEKKDEDIVVKALNTLNEEDPSGEAIKTINAFADWADSVSDEEAIKEAEAYLQELKDSPTVTQRFRKAMAIAMMAMLFGDDFTTAMNTGFGVVADDYAAEALAAKEAADAQAELEKTMAKEQRDFAYKTLGSERDAAEALRLEAYKQGFQSEKERKAAEIARKNKNTEKATEIINSIKDSLKDHKKYGNIATAEMMGEMNGFLRVLDGQMKAVGKQLDLTDWGQREAMSAVLKKWMQERLAFGKAAAPMSTYAQEMFVKSEAQEYIDIDPNLIAPSRDFLLSGDLMTGVDSKKYGTEKQSLRIIKDVLDAKHFGTREGTEAVMELGETIQLIAEKGLGEENTLKLLYKDFLDYRQRSLEDKKHPGKIYNDLERIAYEKGWGPFTHFVNVVLEEIGPTALDENLGMNYDSALQGESKEISTAAIISYLESGIYDLEAIKEQLKK